MKNATFEKLVQNHGISFESEYESKEGYGIERAETITTLTGKKITRYTNGVSSYILAFFNFTKTNSIQSNIKTKSKR